MRPNADDERARVLALLRKSGWNATSFQVLEPGFRYWFDGDDACVAYVEARGTFVVAGAPIAPAERVSEVARRFVEFARASGRRCAFFGVEARMRDAEGLRAMAIGEQPVWDPSSFDAALAGSRGLREQLRRARAKGVRVRRLAADEVRDPRAPIRRAIEALIARWLHARAMAPMGFLVDVRPFDYPDERIYLVAERDGRLVAFLAAVPVYSRRGFLFEDFLRDPDAPNGTAELIIAEGMRAAAGEGSRWVTLGLAPLSGSVPPMLRAARKWSSALYDFGGLRAFKARLRPDGWDTVYLAWPEGQSGLRALGAALLAFARGSFVRFGIETLLRGPVALVRLLALALVPWTVLMALAQPRWFPSRTVHLGWIGFDAVLAVALLSLSARYRGWLASTLAGVVTADAVATLAQIVLWDAPRADRAADWIAIAAGIVGPALGATVLWAAALHRARTPEAPTV